MKKMLYRRNAHAELAIRKTIFESETVCLLFLLNCAFESIDIFKPATSKEGNSEIYVICKEYKKSKNIKTQ